MSMDGKYLFFKADGDIYWVDTTVVDGLRSTLCRQPNTNDGARSCFLILDDLPHAWSEDRHVSRPDCCSRFVDPVD